MCHRISPLVIAELREALSQYHETGHARVPRRDPNEVVPDVYPGRQLPLLVPDEDGQLEPTELTWGFNGPAGTKSKLVFNTRIETALMQARTGYGLWAEPIMRGRCLIPVRGFYEHWTRSAERRRQVSFTLPGHRVFLLAGVYAGDRFSVVTTEPNASVSPFHNRMPLVLGPGESNIWLGSDFFQLADRTGLLLEAIPES